MTNPARHRFTVVSLLLGALLTGGLRSTSAKNQQLEQQVTTQSTEIATTRRR